jgi:hypothetical protein
MGRKILWYWGRYSRYVRSALREKGKHNIAFSLIVFLFGYNFK